MSTSNKSIEQLSVNTIRMLSIDAIEQANSGHPGMPMGAAPMAYVLWTRFMKHNPANPSWFNRDRFVLSAGHASALLYSLLHLTGYDLSLEELRAFRQWGSRTPGHPEYGFTPGVEATTGPLGQGIATAVGMAMAERHLAAVYNRDGFPIVDHHTYVICSDGDLMEGVAAEAASLAGHLKLGKLIVLYDSNDISLDGETSFAFTENVRQRFEAYGWHTLQVEDGNNLEEIAQALAAGREETERPTLIVVRTTIGYGSPTYAGTNKVHGAPLGAEEVKKVHEAYGWPGEETFYVPEEVRQHFAKVKEAGAQAETAWKKQFLAYKAAYPALAEQLEQAIRGELPEGWDQELPQYQPGDKPIATRSASHAALNAISKKVPMLIGGSADLASSNKTTMEDAGIFHAEDYSGRNIWFGVREHAMGSAINGMMLHGGLRPYGATFFVFSDYLRPAIRMSALMKLPVTYIFTHDSIAVGEDGPTHQPIEQLPSMRLIPGLTTIRPADANETVAAWRFAMAQKDTPCALVLSRQNLPILEGTAEKAREGMERGGYILSEAKGGNPQGILIASGSEVSLAMEAQRQLEKEGIHLRVVSMPIRERFAAQPAAYQEEVLPAAVTVRVAIEAAHPSGWESFVGTKGTVIGIDHFGASAPGDQVLKEFGFSVENVVAKVKEVLKK